MAKRNPARLPTKTIRNLCSVPLCTRRARIFHPGEGTGTYGNGHTEPIAPKRLCPTHYNRLRKHGDVYKSHLKAHEISPILTPEQKALREYLAAEAEQRRKEIKLTRLRRP